MVVFGSLAIVVLGCIPVVVTWGLVTLVTLAFGLSLSLLRSLWLPVVLFLVFFVGFGHVGLFVVLLVGFGCILLSVPLLGLVLFLLGVNVGFSALGAILAAELAVGWTKYLLIPLSMLLGWIIISVLFISI